MDLNKFLKTTLANSGASLSFNSGVINPPVGYFSAYEGNELQVAIDDFTLSKLKVLILPYLIQHEALLRVQGNFLGSWINNGVVCIDIAKQFHNETSCKHFAAENKQLAYFDAKNKSSIFV